MKSILITLGVLTGLQLASAQEKLSRDEALQYSALVSADASQLRNTPLPTNVDLKQPIVIQDGDYGGMVLPEAKFSLALLPATEGKIVAVGQLWLHKLTPVRNGAAVDPDALRLAKVEKDGETFTVPQCALGITRNSSGALQLLVYGKGKEPLLRLPLKEVKAGQDSILDMTAERFGDEGVITLRILGKFEATLTVTELEV